MTLLAAGSNSNSQLAIAGEDLNNFKICYLGDVERLSTGGNHTLAIRKNELYGAGLNDNGQLGTLNNKSLEELKILDIRYDGYTPTLCSASWSTSFVLFQSNTQRSSFLVSFGSDEFGIRGVQESSTALTTLSLPLEDHTVIDISSTFRHAVIILKHVDEPLWAVYGWGASRKGQLGGEHSGRSFLSTPHELYRSSTPLIKVRTGREHTIIQSQDGLICWGSNQYGQLNLRHISPVHDFGCTWRGTVVYDGQSIWAGGRSGALPNSNSNEVSPQFVTSSISVKKMAVGSEHTLILDEDSIVWAFGWNEHGNLGLGHNEDRTSPISTNITAKDVFAGNATSFIIT